MDTSKMKNMVVLKDLPSNIIDEAIVILKPNIKVKNFNMVDNKKNGYKKDELKRSSKDYIINEAQMVISNYLSNIEEQKKKKYKKSKEGKRYKILKIATIVSVVLLIATAFYNV